MYARTRLGRLFYDERGRSARSGAREDPRSKPDPALVLLHGLLFDGGSWRGQIVPLAERGRVLVFDGPGHGKSEVPPRFSLEDHAEAMIDAFAELGVNRAIVIGLSWGGMVAMRLAIRHPEKVAGLALLATTAEAPPLGDRIVSRALAAMNEGIGIPEPLYRSKIAPALFAEKTCRERPEIVTASYHRANGFDRTGVTRAALAVSVHRDDITAKLSAIDTPTLVLSGTGDITTTPANAAVIARGIRGAELVSLDDVGHSPALEDPDAVNAQLLPFVDRVLRSP